MGRVAGRYESWFLSARDAEPGRPPRALWIRHTTHRAAGAEDASAALWCTVFDPAGGAPAAVKQSLPELPAGGPARASRARRGRAGGWRSGSSTLTGGGPPLRHLRPSALYRLPLPRTKLEAPVPDGIASGHVVLDGALVDVVGWRATVGHNWGAEHAERWVWLHAAGFEDEPDTWLELAIARVRVGGALTPWIANGAVAHGGQRFRLGGLGHVAGRARDRRARAASRRSSPATAWRSASPSTPTSTRPSASVRGRHGRRRARRARGPARRARRRPPRHPPPRPQLGRAGRHRRRRLRAGRPRVHARGPAPALPGPVSRALAPTVSWRERETALAPG